MEIAVPLNTMDFDFNSPYATSMPSTPRLMGDHSYFSAPTSPTRLSEFCHEFEDLLIAEGNRNSCATVPFAWEERPGKPKLPTRLNCEDDFAFDVSGELGIFENSLSAEDLFDGGVIKPLKPPPRLQAAPFSPRERNKKKKEANVTPERQRGRERGNYALTSSSSRRTRSLSPLRVSEYPWEEEQRTKVQPAATTSTTATTSTRPPLPSTTASTALLSVSSSKGSRKWSLKDLFLFRSASDGRAMDRDPFKKYTTLLRKHEEFKNASLRAFEYNNGSKRRGRVSAHELHYAVNKAVSNDMKKKTFLPYKQGILGRLAFNPTVTALANGFGHQQK